MIRKQIVFLFLIVTSCFFSLQLIAQENSANQGDVRYISDDLFTYLHAGPGLNFRILGSVTAGAKVTLLKLDKENNFAEILDEKNRKGWVNADFINKDSSVRELVPGLQQQVEQHQLDLQQELTNNDILNQKISDLNAEISSLKTLLTASEQTKAEIQQTLDNYNQSAEMEWLTRGGILVIVSVLFGIVITYLPKKRRRNDNWM
ncbi:TIGR04211 family SH3 domain-containing protein [Paraglaciecola aquimarina]|uniref:TIGR04211 family SH3 domain-containing protein n=1 Tax=Paraglaciecola algarum TaxID=3050085 RepID=A0ABS9D6W7_9ALTE|nr:TIGR04211 family SH3 domain-containing protein [Paraglaciecola sp. G1-23]MCF2948693.1 TIGR04211 family SH3 domain-containing protein [Paraglaciecola sp. G1-23]